MKLRSVLVLVVVLLFAQGALSSSRSRAKRPVAASAKRVVGNIRQVDFLNYSYPSSLCHKEFGRQGIGIAVRVRNGRLENDAVYFGVVNDKVLYGDLTADGKEDAAVHVACGEKGANFGLNEILVYTLRNGRVVLLGKITDDDLTRDYSRHYPNQGYFYAAMRVDVRNGRLMIDCGVEGSMAQPTFVATLEYVWRSGLVLSGKPQRRPFRR
jgi:hypothetical protein